MQKFRVLILVLIGLFFIVSCGQEEDENIYGDYGDNSNAENDDNNKPDEHEVKPDADTIAINDSEPDDLADNDTEVSDEEEVDIYKDMVLIPQGTAWVGCNENVETDCPAAELPYHQVSTKAYYIDKYEVTVTDFKKCIDAKKCGEEEFAYNTVKRNP